MTERNNVTAGAVMALVILAVGAGCAGGSASSGGSGGSMGTPGTGGRGSGGSSPGTGGAAPGTGGASGGVSGGGTGGAVPGSGGAGTDALPPDMMPLPPPTVEPGTPPCVRTVPVPNSAALATAVGALMPGDCLVLADGEYTFPVITAKATEAAPIVIKAEKTLGVVVSTGNVAMQGAAYVTVQGVHFKSSGNVRMADCDHCRVSRFRIQRQEAGGEVDWVVVSGTSKYCRIDHNDLGPQTQVGNMIMLSGAGSQIVQYTRIDHNHFHDVTYGGGNGWELIRAGLSGWTFSKAYTVIERNLFVKGDSDPETISLKSSDNTVRYNTMRATRGQFTLRHGNRATVYGNYILGDGRGNGGLRMYGGDHKIYSNYFEGIMGTAINVDAGNSEDDSGMLTDHKVSYNVQVVFNTIVGGRGISVGSGKSIQPRNITVAYNLFKDATPAVAVTAGAQVKALGNMFTGGSAGISEGIMMVDPQLTKMGDLYRIAAGSPVIDAASDMFPFVMEDFEGKPRSKHDVGAEELSTSPAKYGLLKESDVGPMAP